MDNLVNVNVDLAPSEKLSEVISTALGAWMAPWSMKRLAKAEAEAERIKAIESAKTEALLTGDEERYQTLSSIGKRVIAKEIKRQKNIENVVEVANQTIAEESKVSSDPVNPDWATRFFDIAQDISDEAMQDLWGRILAGEVTRPNSYSMRTLEVLRNITREEAQLFEKIAQYVLYGSSYYIYRFSDSTNEKSPIEYADIARLIEIGLLQAGNTVSQNYYNPGGATSDVHLFYGFKYVAFIKITPEIKQLSFPIYSLSKAGEELYKLIQVNPDVEYFEKVLTKIKHKNQNCGIEYAEVVWFDSEKSQFEYKRNTMKEIL